MSRVNNFTILRYILALCIFCNHLCITTGNDIFLCNGAVFVQGFFVISGFLVYNSYVKTNNLKVFAKKRFKRIYPAYAVCVLACFVLGCILTKLPLREFLVHIESFKYLAANLCFLNYIQPTLPGVFEVNPLPQLDSSLWTMKIEIMFYLTIPLVHKAMMKWGKNRTLITLIISSIIYKVATNEIFYATGNTLFYTLKHQIPGELSFFYIPALMVENWELTQKAVRKLAIPALALLVLQFFFDKAAYANPVSISILVLAFAFECKWLLFTHKWRDISYEFYLFRFPVLQTIVFVAPLLPMWQVSAIALPIIFSIAFVMNKMLAPKQQKPASIESKS